MNEFVAPVLTLVGVILTVFGGVYTTNKLVNHRLDKNDKLVENLGKNIDDIKERVIKIEVLQQFFRGKNDTEVKSN